MSFGAGGNSIAAAVRNITHDETMDASWGYEKMDEYRNTFSTYCNFIDEIRNRYKYEKLPQILPCGWRLGPDNPSQLSAGNFLVQGRGSCILHRACKLLHEAKLDIIFTMHDEIGVICNDHDADKVSELMRKLMLQASEDVSGEPGMKIGAPEIVRHGMWWNNHSGRAEKSWKSLKKYFTSE
jgi:hypothetical protein